MRFAGAVLTAASLVGWAPAAFAEPAPNDDFDQAAVIEGLDGVTAGSTVDATGEVGEPVHDGVGGASVWFSWTAVSDGAASFDTFGSGFDTVLAVYTGSRVDALVEVASNDDAGSRQSLVLFPVSAGTTYLVAVAGYDGDTGEFTLRWRPTDPPSDTAPPNDDFDERSLIEGSEGATASTTVLATLEPGEPQVDISDASVWFSWTAPQDARLTFDTLQSNIDTSLAVFSGDAIGELTLVAVNDDDGPFSQSRVVFGAAAGTVYSIRVATSSEIDQGPFTLHWETSSGSVPSNDNFAAARPINGASGVVTGTNTGATTEPFEQSHAAADGGSVWFRWTAPTDGPFWFDTFGSSFDTGLAVYTGSRVDDAHQLAASAFFPGRGLSRLTLWATAGTDYAVAVAGQDGATGEYTVRWEPRVVAPPENDELDQGSLIEGPEGATWATNLAATDAPGEPLHAGSGTASVWFTWTAPDDGAFWFDTIGRYGWEFTPLDTTLAVYTGDDITSLATVVVNDDNRGAVKSGLTLRAIAGMTYRIAVAGFDGATGDFTLRWLPVAAVGNDDVANPTQLEGESGTLVQARPFATIEPGEPNHGGVPGGASVWYRWTAPRSGRFGFDTYGSGLVDLHLAVYTGHSLDTLTQVAAGDDAPGARFDYLSPRVEFEALRGTSYLIAVDTFQGLTGGFHLSWRRPPGNDDVADAQRIQGPIGTTDGVSLVASGESGEPDRIGGGGASVWYRWRAPTDGPVLIDTGGSDFDTTLSVYTGRVRSHLTLVTEADGPLLNAMVTFTATAGTDYLIAVDGFRQPDTLAAAGNVRLRWWSRPPNDDLADAERLEGPSGDTSGLVSFATTESDEPDHGGEGHSVWYRWTAPHDAVTWFSTVGSARATEAFHGSGAVLDTVLAAYVDGGEPALELVASDDRVGDDARDSGITFRAERGTTYLIAVDSALGHGPITLSWAMAPPNDDLASAATLRGASGRVDGTNIWATNEPGEPESGNGSNSTVWYRWTAPHDGVLTVDGTPASHNAALFLDAYTGASLDTLVRAQDHDAPPYEPQPAIQVPVLRGTTYLIAVDGVIDYEGDPTFEVHWRFQRSTARYPSRPST
jgi:hypothetical protein